MTVSVVFTDVRDVVTPARSAGGRDGEQAELLMRASYPQGVPVRGLAMADVQAPRRPLAQVNLTMLNYTHIFNFQYILFMDIFPVVTVNKTELGWIETRYEFIPTHCLIRLIQGGREVSAIIVTDNYLCYKEPKKFLQLFSYFNI